MLICYAALSLPLITAYGYAAVYDADATTNKLHTTRSANVLYELRRYY